MGRFTIEKNGRQYRAMWYDNGGMSVIYVGSKKECQKYIDTQKRKLSKGGLIHESKTISKAKFDR